MKSEAKVLIDSLNASQGPIGSTMGIKGLLDEKEEPFPYTTTYEELKSSPPSEFYRIRTSIPKCAECGRVIQFFEDTIEGNCKTCHRKLRIEEKLAQMSKRSLETRVANIERFLLESENNLYSSLFKI